MKRLNNLQLIIYRLGGLLVVLGAILNPVKLDVAPYIYSVGALMFASMQLLARYDGANFVIRRLRRQQILGALLLVLAGAAMFANEYGVIFLRNNEWMIVLVIAAVLELYTAFRIPYEVEKEQREDAKA